MKKNMNSQEIRNRRMTAIKNSKKKANALTQKERYKAQKKKMEEWKAWFK